MAFRGAIDLVRISGLGALPELFEQRAGERALQRVFEQEGLPTSVIGAPQTPIPLTAMIGLIERCARHLGDRTFGLDIGQGMPETAYGMWARYGMSAPTLGAALRRLCATDWAQSSSSSLDLVWDTDHWLWRNVMPPTGLDVTQHADHVLPPMMWLCRLYLGQDWRPAWVEVNYPRAEGAALLEDRLQIPVMFGRSGTGVVLKPADLARERRTEVPGGGGPVTLREVVADVALSDAPEPARSLSAVVALRLLDGKADIDGAARMAGLSVQGLQRRLRDKGYSYRDIVDVARRERALALLHETELPLMDIAISLGYEEHANFTRAFRRWMGRSPSEFRRSGEPVRHPD